jgi:polyisoprenoid-binding protein YceI
VAGFSARGSIKRSDFGMRTLIPYVSDKVDLVIETEATR